jgi:hypothetical protein
MRMVNVRLIPIYHIFVKGAEFFGTFYYIKLQDDNKKYF